MMFDARSAPDAEPRFHRALPNPMTTAARRDDEAMVCAPTSRVPRRGSAPTTMPNATSPCRTARLARARFELS